MGAIDVRRAALLVAMVAGVSLLTAGCGSGKPSPSVADIGATTTSATSTSSANAGSGTAAGGPGSQTANAGGSGGGGQFTLAGGSLKVMSQFAACMRTNGEPNFPDPNAQGQISISSSAAIDPGSAQFQQAQQACRKLLPNGGTPSPAQQAQARQQALAFSACMRKNGVPNFPDPQFSSGGGVSIRIQAGAGIDPRSPQFQAARKACQKDMPGIKSTSGAAP